MAEAVMIYTAADPLKIQGIDVHARANGFSVPFSWGI